ncbi:aromatic aldehyde synthase [Klebsormidium nitens]|uniref:Aromatic aldehyde synthase n=1 Tax=Klebsormidium nitens TaxID=105231 RepID=A0A1Y1I601_KLENI|nr:aromatic aldehyde synthase [Klebsormidium nitens]|eukprot:GAQ86385.1 aromatic aldehyde synthase [Klebsormidium nitens]
MAPEGTTNGTSSAAPAANAMAGLQPLDPEEFRRHAHQMVDFVADYYKGIESFPVRSEVKPGYLRPLLPDVAPEQAESLDSILEDVRSHILPGVTHWQSPNFYAYFPSNSSTAGYLGEMLSGAINIVGFHWLASPAATELEMLMLDWVGRLLNLPEAFLHTGGTGGGVIQGTASEAVLVALLAARQKWVAKLTQGGDISQSEALSKLVVYTSDQAHSCVQKACMVAGIEKKNWRFLKTSFDTNFAIDPAVFEEAVKKDLEAGLVPAFLCATVGTTSSTAIDPLKALGTITQEHGMWMHVDAAYAGPACICPELRHHLDGVELVDSFCMNAHKWMLTNFDCSLLWVKDSKPLLDALSLQPEYLRNAASEASLVVDFKDWQLPLGRRFRSLKLWLVMRLYGANGIRAYLRKHIQLAAEFEELVRADERYEVLVPRTFALLCFRAKPPAGDPDNGRTLNATLLENVNKTGKLFFTHTVLDGVYTLRFCVGNSRTEREHVLAAWDVINQEAEKLLKGSA